MPPAADADDRLAALEQAVAELRRDLGALRAELRAARLESPDTLPTAAPVATPAAPPPAAPAYVPRYLRPAPGARAAAYLRTRAAGLRTGPDGRPADLEALVGRYGTVAVAALLILSGVGAFLAWAVDTFTINPRARVALGAMLAAALAAGGWRLRTAGVAGDADDEGRREGTSRFGDLLLALALAVTHVDAWAAGPYLGLIPPPAALGLAAAASAALAALAWRGRQPALFVVGVGGALVAPFVTGAAAGQPLALVAYGWVVLSAGALAVPSDASVASRWRWAVRLLPVGGAGYALQLLADASRPLAPHGGAGALALSLPALLPLAAAAAPLTLAGRRPAARGTLGGLVLAYVATAAFALLAVGARTDAPDYPRIALAMAATVVTFAAAVRTIKDADSTAPATRVWIAGPLVRVSTVTAALVLPLLLLGAALLAAVEISGARGAGVAAAWAVVSAAAAWMLWQRSTRGPAPIRLDAPTSAADLVSAAAAVAGIASALAVVLVLPGRDVLRVTLLAAHAAATAQLFGPLRRPLALLAPVVAACAAAGWAAVLLAARPAYAYAPFLTAESLAAGAVVAAWGVVAWRVRRAGGAVLSTADRRIAVGAAAIVALLWGRQELADAVSPDVSTFLLVGYFALAGIGAIALGRARALPAARQAGLALALYAAFKAFAQASALDAVGLRVGSYLLVGGFLLAVGYWYRAAGAPVRPVPSGPA